MPSSEFSMLTWHCGKTVQPLVKSVCRTCFVCTESTDLLKYLTSQVLFMRSFCTAITQPLAGFKQQFLHNYYLLLSGLYPLYTAPIINTKYIKE